jgi:hypothetical protein
MLAITLALNMPINLAVFGWAEEHRRSRTLAPTPPTVGPDPHRPVLLDSSGFALVAIAAVWH